MLIQRNNNLGWSAKDIALSRFICIHFIMNAFNSIFQDVLHFSGNRLLVAKAGIGLILGICLFIAFRHLTKNEWMVFIIIELLISIIYVYSYLADVPVSTFSSWASTTLLMCVPLGICTYFVREKRVLYQMLLRTSGIILILLMIDMANSTDRYDMHFSYMLLFLILLHLNELINTRKKWLIPLLLVECYMLFMYGSRGALVSIFSFLFLKIYVNIKGIWKKVYYSALLVIGAAILFTILENGDEIWLYMRSHDYYSRTLNLLLTGRFFSHDSGRGELYKKVLSLIMEKPLYGWGIRGAVKQMGHPYPHQFFYDLWLTFGIPFGSVLIVILVLPLRHLFMVMDDRKKDLVHIFFCGGFIPLMFSSTLFTNYYYAIFCGLLFSTVFMRKGSYEYSTSSQQNE